MDLADVLESLMARPIATWPSFVCGALDSRAGRVCGLHAQWMKFPIPGAHTAWTYCDRHRPPDAERIPEDVPYAVTRLELRVAIAGRPGELAASADEAVRLVVFALEDVGATVTGLRVVGGKATQAGAEGPPLRILLAGPSTPVLEPGEPYIAFRRAPAGRWWRRWHAG